jgi:hypothetical protein
VRGLQHPAPRRTVGMCDGKQSLIIAK